MYKSNKSRPNKSYGRNSFSKRRHASKGGFGGSSYSRGGNYSNRGPKKNFRGEFIKEEMYISKILDESTPSSPYYSSKTFSDFYLHERLKKNILDRNYSNPTKIQDQAIPEIMRGKDILGLASTGSGKTAAFLIPLIDKVLKGSKQRCLIVTPTRELASQIGTEFRKFSADTHLSVVMVIGGASIGEQVRYLRRGPQFVIATPGRLIDLEKRGSIDLGMFNNIVLDEVDQMLDMGFVEDIKLIISKLASPRQSLFFSATMSPKVELIANSLLKDPVRIEVEKKLEVNRIEQNVIRVKSKTHKIEELRNILVTEEYNKVLVFSKTKRGADEVSDELQKLGFKVDSLHGDKSQMKRSKVLSKFRKTEIDVLVATDVAARGIDIPDISHVINFDEPATYNDYIHRIGRTGRIGKKGKALTFVMQGR